MQDKLDPWPCGVGMLGGLFMDHVLIVRQATEL